MKEVGKWILRKWWLWTLIGLFLWSQYEPRSFFQTLRRINVFTTQFADSTKQTREKAKELKKDVDELRK